MSLVVKEEPEYQVPCESEQDGLHHVKFERIEILMEPECILQEEPQCDKEELPGDSERGSAVGSGLQTHCELPPSARSERYRSREQQNLLNQGSITVSPTIAREACSKLQPRECLKKQTIQQKHVCNICNKEFTKPNALNAHIKTHERIKPFCDICKKEFGRQSNLNTHNKRLHSQEKPYSCDVCKKEFKEAYVLRRHLRIHTGEKPYTCDICGKRFSSANHLKDHTRIHTQEKPFTCDICNKQFKRRYTLKCHTILHTGEKPYSCGMCDKKFIRTTDLQEHALSHGEGKPYACEKCKAEFSRKDTYFRHVKRSICRGSGRPVKEKKYIVN